MKNEERKPTHIIIFSDGGQARVNILNCTGKGKDGLNYFNVITSPRSPLYRQGIHTISGIPETNLRPITSKGTRALKKIAREWAANCIQGSTEAGGISYLCDRLGLTEQDDITLCKMLDEIIEDLRA